jgi:hypothetical protein
MTQQIKLPHLKCHNPKCLHEWTPRVAEVRRCPKCGVAAWSRTAPRGCAVVSELVCALCGREFGNRRQWVEIDPPSQKVCRAWRGCFKRRHG